MHVLFIFSCAFFLFSCVSTQKEIASQKATMKNEELLPSKNIKNNPRQDYNQIFFEFVQADALTGTAKAQYKLGMLYKESVPPGIIHNQEKSANWLLKAAAQGNTDALEEIRRLSDKGLLEKEKLFKVEKQYQENHSKPNTIDLTPSDKQTYEKVLKLLHNKAYEEALPFVKQLADKYTGHLGVMWTAGIAAKKSGDYLASIKYFKTFKERVIYDVLVRSNLIIVYQALGDLEKRDLEREALYAYRALSPYLPPEKSVQDLVFVREEFSIGSRHVSVLEYFELLGDRGVKYAFRIRDSKTNESWRISLGSYERTNNLMKKEKGLGPADPRYYHLDAYDHLDDYVARKHWTFGFFLGEPEYDEIRPLVMKIVSEGPDKFAVSSSVLPPRKDSSSNDSDNIRKQSH